MFIIYRKISNNIVHNVNYQGTIYACYIAYVVQGIINNINPLLFVIYQRLLGIPFYKIGILIAANFGIQILTDFLSARYVDRFGYRRSIMFAHFMSTLGLIGIGIFPFIFSDPFVGLVLATMLNGIGGGLLEVMVSPIVEATPSNEKEKAMSTLHSFYCWGCLLFISLSTIFLRIIGSDHWYCIPIVWAIVPFLNLLFFSKVPINTLVNQEEKIPVKYLLKKRIFWLLVIIMICSGASELAMSQWVSYFAETGLHVNKTIGDLLGACFFCVLMGLSRLFYGKFGHKVELKKFMYLSCFLCVAGYLMAVFSPIAIIGLLGCGICGLSVGILWPGTFSIAAKACREGGTAMFAFLALAGDIGCVSGPEIVSIVANALPQHGIKAGLLVAILFPILLVITLKFGIKHK